MVAPYKSLLKEVANGLKEKDVKEITFLLGFDAATEISSGIQLVREMENQDLLDEDNLTNLKDALKEQKLKKLVKLVTAFEDSKTGTADPLSKTWPTSGFSNQQLPSDKSRTQSVTTEPAPSMAQYQGAVQQHYPGSQWVAPPGSYQGNVEMVPPVNQYSVYQQPPHLQQQNPGVVHPMQGQMVSEMAYQQGPPSSYPYQHGMTTPGYVAMAAGGGSSHSVHTQQQELQHMVQHLHLQRQQMQISASPVTATAQHSHHKYTGADVPGSLPNDGAQQTPGHLPRVRSCPRASRNPQTQDNPPQDGTGHAKLSAVKSAPSSTSSATQLSGNSRIEPQVGLKGAQLPKPTATEDKSMNIPPVNKSGVVAEATFQNTKKGNIIAKTSSFEGLSSTNGIWNDGHDTAQDGSHTYQTGRVRVNSGSLENNESLAVPTQPMTLKSVTDAEQLLLSGFTLKQLYEHHKVDSFEDGPYQVTIPEGSHYLTSEGMYVVVKFNSDYSIKLRNNDPRLRCSGVINYNGKFAGDWTIDPGSSITVERPAYENKKFHFVEASRAPQGSGVREGDPNNGLIQVTFTPERSTTEPWNDLSRGFDDFGTEPQTDYFGADSALMTGSDIQRGFVQPPPADWRAGATILEGRSDQQFAPSEVFQVDKSQRRVVELRLVGK